MNTWDGGWDSTGYWDMPVDISKKGSGGIVVDCGRDCWSRPGVPRVPQAPPIPPGRCQRARAAAATFFSSATKCCQVPCWFLALSACPVCCQTRWQSSFPAGRVNGLADFGRDMITDCFRDLGSTSNLSCSNLGVIPSAASWGTFLQAARADH